MKGASLMAISFCAMLEAFPVVAGQHQPALKDQQRQRKLPPEDEFDEYVKFVPAKIQLPETSSSFKTEVTEAMDELKSVTLSSATDALQ